MPPLTGLTPFNCLLPPAYCSAQRPVEEINQPAVVGFVLFGGGGGDGEAGEREVCVRLDVGAAGEAVGERLGRLLQTPRALAREQEHLPVAEPFGERAGRVRLVAPRV